MKGKDFMRCHNCDKKVQEDFIVCPYCGAKLSDVKKITNKVEQKKNNNSVIINGYNKGDIVQAQSSVFKIEYEEHEDKRIKYKNDTILKKVLNISTVLGVISSIITIAEFVSEKIYIRLENANLIFIISSIIMAFSIYNIFNLHILSKNGEIKTFLNEKIYKDKEEGVYYISKKYIDGKCPICDGEVYLDDFDYNGKLKRYGVCKEQPSDHIFTFKEVGILGVIIGENEKAKLKKDTIFTKR